MGIRVDDPPEFSPSDCGVCSEPGGTLWPAGENPGVIFVSFWDMVKCNPLGNTPPNGHQFSCQQDPASLCIWRHIGAWTVAFEPALFGPPRSRVTLTETSTGISYFVGVGAQCPPALSIFQALNATCTPLIGASEGHCIITWMGEINELVIDYNIPTRSQLFYELFVKNGTIPVHKFCNSEKSLNVKFEIP